MAPVTRSVGARYLIPRNDDFRLDSRHATESMLATKAATLCNVHR
jgi:hypothetical protein